MQACIFRKKTKGFRGRLAGLHADLISTGGGASGGLVWQFILLLIDRKEAHGGPGESRKSKTKLAGRRRSFYFLSKWAVVYQIIRVYV